MTIEEVRKWLVEEFQPATEREYEAKKMLFYVLETRNRNDDRIKEKLFELRERCYRLSHGIMCQYCNLKPCQAEIFHSILLHSEREWKAKNES